MSVLEHTLNASHAGKIKRQEGNVESIHFLMQLNHECIKVWTTQNKNDPNKLFIRDILKYLHGLPCLVKKGKMEKQN